MAKVDFDNKDTDMKFIKIGMALVLTIYFARFLGSLIISRDIMNGIIVFLVGLLFLLSSLKQKYAIFTFVSFIPFAFHKKLTGAELLAPLIFFIILIDLIENKKSLLSKEASIWIVAIGIISTWALINYVRNPVAGMFFMGSGIEQTGIRAYYRVFVGITIFFSSYWFIQYKKIDVRALFKFMIGIALFLGLLKTVSYLSGMHIPLLNKFYAFSTMSETKTFFRIQGLSGLMILGITLLLAMTFNDMKTSVRNVLLSGFVFLLLLSGARTMFAAAMLSIFIFIAFIRKTSLLPLLLSLAVVVPLYILVIPQIELTGHLERMTSVSEAVEQQSDYRLEAYAAYINEFIKNPVFGKGIGYTGDLNKIDYVSGNLAHGGHGAYLSVLGIYGIGGFVYFCLLVFGTLYHSYKLLKVYIHQKSSVLQYEYAVWIVFAFLYIIIRSINLVPAGDGISEYDIWYLAGIVAGIRTLYFRNLERTEDQLEPAS